ncbi:MAG: hypothetical protein Q9191_005498 [Dirinaria sp. TL-2023a]
MADRQSMNRVPSATAASPATRLRGHVGYLTQEESAALDAFKQLTAKNGFFTPGTAKKKPSHDDGTLVYACPASKFVVQDAYEQFKDTEIWRKDNNLEALYEKIDIQDYQQARSVYPQWTGRRDKRGIPVYLFEVGKLDSKKMIAYSSATSKSKVKGPSPSRMLRLFALYENLTRFVMPLCTAVPGRPNPETPVDQSNNIVDISRVGLKQFWNLKNHMQDASQLATAHYPETLDRIFIIGAPAFFPTVWGWIKRWFDPITTSKIFILSEKDVYPTLVNFIDHDSIPKKYGGGLNFECGKLPVLDPQVRGALDIRGSEEMFLTAPVRWMDDENGEMMALGVGSIDGRERKERMAVLHSLALKTLTRSSTHQDHLPLYRPDTAQTQSQPLQADIIKNMDRNSTPSSSRPESRDHPTVRTTPQQQTSEPAPIQQAPVQQAPPLEASRPPPEPPSTHVPVRPSASLAERVQPGFNESHREPAKTLTSEAPDGTPVANGKPKSVPMPERPVRLERNETVYMTPASEPSEIPDKFL